MQMPRNYEQTAVYGDYESLEVGGHLCVIRKVEEATSKRGNNMLNIYLDTAPDDKQPGFYAKRYKEDSRPAEEKRWGCIVYQLTEDVDGFCSRGFKSFVTAVEESNPRFRVEWGDRFCECFKGMRVGGVFRREQYEARDGSLKWSVKCNSFRSIQDIMDGVDVPEDKYLDDKRKNNSYTPPVGFTELTDGDGELPF